jgi:hypothetical protein
MPQIPFLPIPPTAQRGAQLIAAPIINQVVAVAVFTRQASAAVEIVLLSRPLPSRGRIRRS